MDVFNVRSEATAEASLAAILERSKFGFAIAAMIRIIATTISNSINEKPFCLLRILVAPVGIIEIYHCYTSSALPTTVLLSCNAHANFRLKGSCLDTKPNNAFLTNMLKEIYVSVSV